MTGSATPRSGLTQKTSSGDEPCDGESEEGENSSDSQESQTPEESTLEGSTLEELETRPSSQESAAEWRDAEQSSEWLDYEPAEYDEAAWRGRMASIARPASAATATTPKHEPT